VKTYRHYRPAAVWAPVIILFVVALVCAGVVVMALLLPSARGFPWPIVFLPAAILVLNVLVLGRTTYEITLHDTTIEMAAPLRRVSIPIRDITRLAPLNFGHGPWFVLKHRGGRVILDPRLNGMHELIAELKQRNPNIELVGC
jgi:hypothetical protein